MTASLVSATNEKEFSRCVCPEEVREVNRVSEARKKRKDHFRQMESKCKEGRKTQRTCKEWKQSQSGPELKKTLLCEYL